MSQKTREKEIQNQHKTAHKSRIKSPRVLSSPLPLEVR